MGYTQEKLGELANVNPKYLSDIERGKKNPSANILYKISAALNISPIMLFTSNAHKFEYGYVIMDSSSTTQPYTLHDHFPSNEYKS